MPIGNLTSQIFANIYLNELDRFVKHVLKPKGYLRYGDDFILVADSQSTLEVMRCEVITFLSSALKVNINPKSDKILKVSQGLYFLGAMIWPTGRRLNARAMGRIETRLSEKNIGSYWGLLSAHTQKGMRKFGWMVGAILRD